MRRPDRLLLLLGAGLALGLILTYQAITGETARRHDRLELQLQVQQWLSELSGELADSSQRKLFPNRAELHRSEARESRHPENGLVELSHTPVGPARVHELGSGTELPFTQRGPRSLGVQAGGPVLVEYPVDDLTVYWVEAHGFFRQRRDAEGVTELTRLNPEHPVSGLRFRQLGPGKVRVELTAGSITGVQVVTTR